MATSNNDRVSSARLLDMLKGLQESRHLGSEPEVDPQTNEKTKHTIKQDYLPNADWNVNDPDADGYVQGRTHWVERTVGDIPVTTEQDMSTIPDMVKPEGFKAGTTTWKPDYEAIAFEEAETQSGMTLTGYLLAEDENGVQITDPEIAISGTFYSGIVVADYSAYFPDTIIVAAKYNGNDTTCEYVIGETEVVHKLDRKFYDYTPPVDLTPYQKRIDLNNKDIDYNGIGTNFPVISTGEFAITTTNNIIHDLTVGNSSELLQFHHLWYERNLYSKELHAAALFWLIANCCTKIKDEQTNVYTVNSIEKRSVNAFAHSAVLKTNDGEFTLEVSGSSCSFVPPSNVEGNTFTLTVDYYITGDMLSKGSLINSSLLSVNDEVSLLSNGVLMVRYERNSEITIPKNTLGVRGTSIGRIMSNTVIDNHGDLWHAEGIYSETNLTIKFAKKVENEWQYGRPDSATVFMFANTSPVA